MIIGEWLFRFVESGFAIGMQKELEISSPLTMPLLRRRRRCEDGEQRVSDSGGCPAEAVCQSCNNVSCRLSPCFIPSAVSDSPAADPPQRRLSRRQRRGNFWRSPLPVLALLLSLSFLLLHHSVCANNKSKPRPRLRTKPTLIRAGRRQFSARGSDEAVAGAYSDDSTPPCLSASGELGTCMFLKPCIDLGGRLAGTCFNKFFFASCCVVQNGTRISERWVG